jgi:hypothetical protein
MTSQSGTFHIQTISSQRTTTKMTPKPSLLRAHYARLARLWPADPLRPHLPFRRVLVARHDDPVLSESTSAAPQPNAQPSSSSPDDGTLEKQGGQQPPIDPLAEHHRAVNALYSLLDDRFSRKVRPLHFLLISSSG